MTMIPQTSALVVVAWTMLRFWTTRSMALSCVRRNTTDHAFCQIRPSHNPTILSIECTWAFRWIRTALHIAPPTSLFGTGTTGRLLAQSLAWLSCCQLHSGTRDQVWGEYMLVPFQREPYKEDTLVSVDIAARCIQVGESANLGPEPV